MILTRRSGGLRAANGALRAFKPSSSLIPAAFALFALTLSGTVALVPGAAQAQSSTTAAATAQPVDEKAVIARIDGVEYVYSDILAIHRNLPQQYRQLPVAALYDQLLNQLVERHLLSAAAKTEGLDKDAKVAADLRAAEMQVLAGNYARRLIEEKITDEMVAAEHAKTATQGTEDEVRARHILVETEADARAIAKELRSGADFAKLAAEKSIGPSKSQGGDLGYFTKDKMVPPFAEAAFNLKKGEISDPVKTQFGWHVIKLEDRRKAQGPGLEEKGPEIRQRLIGELLQAEFADRKKAAKMELFSPDGKPMQGAVNQ